MSCLKCGEAVHCYARKMMGQENDFDVVFTSECGSCGFVQEQTKYGGTISLPLPVTCPFCGLTESEHSETQERLWRIKAQAVA